MLSDACAEQACSVMNFMFLILIAFVQISFLLLGYPTVYRYNLVMQDKSKKKSVRKIKVIPLLTLLFTVFMAGVFVMGVYSFITVPPIAAVEAKEIEEMLKKQQEEAERQRIKQEEELARRKALEEEIAKNPLLVYDDAAELQVTGIGDSVMLAATNALYKTFPHGYFDAKYGRTIYQGKKVLQELEEKGTLGDVIVFSLGTNCIIKEDDLEDLVSHCGGKPTFWITTYGVANDSNEKMTALTEKYDNAFMIDWETLALANRKEYVLPDRLHPTDKGSAAYAELIRQRITECVLTSQYKENKGS